jgi:hypothetical protein
MKKTAAFLMVLAVILFSCKEKENRKINRHDLVTRHNVLIEGYDSLASLSVGNGNFAFTTDLTGLQTFYEEYAHGVPLGTMSNWGWHTNPNADNFKIDETWQMFEVEGRQVPYRIQRTDSKRAMDAANYFRENPHRLHLGIIGLVLTKPDETEARISEIKNARHHLNLWTGCISSEFIFDGQPVKVEVYCHQEKDLISARIESPLIKSGQLAVRWKFPFAVAENTNPGYDFDSPSKHQSILSPSNGNSARIERILDNDHYQVAVTWEGKAVFENREPHLFILNPGVGEKEITFSCLFSPTTNENKLPDFSETKAENQKTWSKFWQTGGAIDFSGCTDPRAKELERRVVLSQYLTKIQSSGTLPPAETGLTYNSWYGKFHLEMHWWHSSHFAQWQRSVYLAQQLEFYKNIYQKALLTSQEQGYAGIRWPKMVGPEGENSPSSVGSFLIWQQPHFIWFAEQLYRQNPGKEILEKYKDLVFASADFMASFPILNKKTGKYDLAPPLIPAQEHWNRTSTFNPPFELAYWYWGLSTAQKWRERAGLESDKKWGEVLLKLPAPDTAEGVYLGIQGALDSYTNPAKMKDHPIVLGAYGILPKWEKIDPEIMKSTLKLVRQNWDWASTWGWDYPMAAMCAARCGEPELALDFLLLDVQKNTYLKSGHNYQNERLRIYLPGNGGLLSSIAMMCAGWDGNTTNNPGFPKNGKWKVKWENLSPAF